MGLRCKLPSLLSGLEREVLDARQTWEMSAQNGRRSMTKAQNAGMPILWLFLHEYGM